MLKKVRVFFPFSLKKNNKTDKNGEKVFSPNKNIFTYVIFYFFLFLFTNLMVLFVTLRAFVYEAHPKKQLKVADETQYEMNHLCSKVNRY